MGTDVEAVTKNKTGLSFQVITYNSWFRKSCFSGPSYVCLEEKSNEMFISAIDKMGYIGRKNAGKRTK